MRLLAACALAACSTPNKPAAIGERPTAPPSGPPSGPVNPAAIAAPPGSPPALVRTTARAARVEAPHGGAITSLAVSPDGAVVSCDELGGVRLWPKLDGTTEPRVVELPKPDGLALGRDPRGYVIAMTDSVGGLVIQLVDPDGLTLQRAVLAPEPAYAGVATSAHGVIAWRTDQRVMRIASDGSIASQLAAEPGQRLVTLAVAGDRAVAVLEMTSSQDKPVRRARWLALAGDLAWGAWLGGPTALGDQIALSPSAARVATLTGGRVRVYDTRKGAQLADEPAPTAVAVGMTTEDHIALGVPGGSAVAWVDLARATPHHGPTTPDTTPQPGPSDAPVLGVAGGRAITAISGELVLATPTAVQYLGYELESPAVAAGAPGGKLLIGLGDTFAQLDRKLDASPAPDLAIPASTAIADLRWLGGDEWLVESSRINDGVTSVALVDTASHRSTTIRKGMAMVHLLRYEPSTRLATLSLGDAPEVLRHTPGKQRLDRVALLPRPAGFERTELVPVSPALATGTQLVVVQMRDRLTIRWLHDADLRALDRGGSPVTVDGSLAGVGAAGHVFVWQSDPQGTLELVIYRGGKRTGVLPTDGPTAVWPDPSGTRVVEVSQRSIRLVPIDGGATIWAMPLERVTEALWLDDGSLGIVSAAGIARLDAATGAVIAARCGWRFGLSPRQHPVSPRVEPVCTQLR